MSNLKVEHYAAGFASQFKLTPFYQNKSKLDISLVYGEAGKYANAVLSSLNDNEKEEFKQAVIARVI